MPVRLYERGLTLNRLFLSPRYPGSQTPPLMSSLKYGDDNGPGDKLSDTYHYSQFVHLPHGVTKVSGQGGWDLDGNIDADDWRGQIERAFDNLDRVLKVAGLSGLDDVSTLEAGQCLAVGNVLSDSAPVDLPHPQLCHQCS